MNKALLHIGMLAAITGISHCYASGSGPNAAPLVNDPKDSLNIFDSLCDVYKKNFLAENP